MNRQKTSLMCLAAGLTLLAAFSAAPAFAIRSAVTCNPRTYGAKGDGISKDTAAIQAAIDACGSQGGGTVRLIAGTCLSAPIVLKSHITLQFDKGATLLGSADHGDHPARTEFHLPDLQPIVSAIDASHVAITGEDVIDGQGQSQSQVNEQFLYCVYYAWLTFM